MKNINRLKNRGKRNEYKHKTRYYKCDQSICRWQPHCQCLETFQVLGYVTEHQAPLRKPSFAEFEETYIGDKKFDEIKAVFTAFLDRHVNIYLKPGNTHCK